MNNRSFSGDRLQRTNDDDDDGPLPIDHRERRCRSARERQRGSGGGDYTSCNIIGDGVCIIGSECNDPDDDDDYCCTVLELNKNCMEMK